MVARGWGRDCRELVPEGPEFLFGTKKVSEIDGNVCTIVYVLNATKLDT